MNRLIATLLLACSFTLVGCGGSGPGDSVEGLLLAMEDGDTEKVKELAPGMSMAGEKLDGMVKQAAMEVKKKGGIDNVEITDETVNGDTATVKFVVSYGNGEKDDEETAELVKMDGKWIVDMGEDGDKPMDMGGGGGGPTIDFGDNGGDFPDGFPGDAPAE